MENLLIAFLRSSAMTLLFWVKNAKSTECWHIYLLSSCSVSRRFGGFFFFFLPFFPPFPFCGAAWLCYLRSLYNIFGRFCDTIWDYIDYTQHSLFPHSIKLESRGQPHGSLGKGTYCQTENLCWLSRIYVIGETQPPSSCLLPCVHTHTHSL